MKKKKITKEEFVSDCYRKAGLKLWFQMRKLILPTACRIMEKEINNFQII